MASCLCQRELFTVEFRETLHGPRCRAPRRTELIKFRIERGPALEQRGARVGKTAARRMATISAVVTFIS